MSKHYSHRPISRRNTNRRHKKKKSGVFFIMVIFAVLIFIFLARDIKPKKEVIEKDITNTLHDKW